MNKVIAPIAEKQESAMLFELVPIIKYACFDGLQLSRLSTFSGSTVFREYKCPGYIIDRIVSCIKAWFQSFF